MEYTFVISYSSVDSTRQACKGADLQLLFLVVKVCTFKGKTASEGAHT